MIRLNPGRTTVHNRRINEWSSLPLETSETSFSEQCDEEIENSSDIDTTHANQILSSPGVCSNIIFKRRSNPKRKCSGGIVNKPCRKDIYRERLTFTTSPSRLNHVDSSSSINEGSVSGALKRNVNDISKVPISSLQNQSVETIDLTVDLQNTRVGGLDLRHKRRLNKGDIIIIPSYPQPISVKPASYFVPSEQYPTTQNKHLASLNPEPPCVNSSFPWGRPIREAFIGPIWDLQDYYAVNTRNIILA